MFDLLPNILTLLRIAVVPVVALLFFIPTEWSSWAAATLFILACITDYLDGYFARLLNQQTALGTFLDPIADKLLVSSTLLLLAGFDRIQGISLIPAVVILCREVLVSGLREFLAEIKVSIPVTRLAKWKTAVQMVALTLLVANAPQVDSTWLALLGLIGLWLAAALTLITGYDYLKAGLPHILGCPPDAP
ncbi:MAG: CDP-diacylglycerol--glycerol-3-phosphate 3-phosphatidyltransferase [Holosporales bacterium]